MPFYSLPLDKNLIFNSSRTFKIVLFENSKKNFFEYLKEKKLGGKIRSIISLNFCGPQKYRELEDLKLNFE